jgi:putative GTP pyrophosphokinase
MDCTLSELPEKSKLLLSYEQYHPFFTQILNGIEVMLRNQIHLASVPTYKTRIKSFESYYKKLLRVKPPCQNHSESPLIVLTDIIGIRIICAFLEDLSEVERQIQRIFDVREIEHKGASQNFREFGYESIHVLVAIPSSCTSGVEVSLPPGLVCEIQIRTILQDAWAEVEHELVYKTEFSPFDMPLRRKLASMNASLSLADIIFQEIRDYQKKLQGEVEDRRKSFYEQADRLTQGEVPLVPVRSTDDKINRVTPYVRGTIDDMLLEAIHAHNHGDLDLAISLYTRIIESDPPPSGAVLTVIFKHRGMAYFAKADYQRSLADFSQSIEYDSQNFRAHYYKGIVYSVLGDNMTAITCFTRSLEINEYQSHARYRRALSRSKIGADGEALTDVVAAEQLGLCDADCTALKNTLLEKLGMK